MKQETAVEWFYHKLVKGKLTGKDTIEFLYEVAKEMEKEQIMDAYGDEQSHLQDDGSWKRTTAEQYYNETYEN